MKSHTIVPAERITGLEEYYFSSKLREIREMNRTGIPVINLGIGSPDLAPDQAVTAKLAEVATLSDHHSYQPYTGIPELRKAFAGWYSTWFSVELDPEREILPLIGSKEGLMHIAMAMLNPGDEALVPDPSYPAYQSVTKLAGATPRSYQLTPENDWLPDLAQLEKEGLKRVKVMWVNYPHMPTGRAAEKRVFESLVDFGIRHNILIVNDNPYSFILNDQPLSILSVKGAKVGVLELNSLSKSHNMAGWRIGMVAGNPELLGYILRFKSQMDSGMFKPMQLAAVEALKLGKDWYQSVNAVYRSRRELIWELLDKIGCTYDPKQNGMFVWARIPEEVPSGRGLAEEILVRDRVFITPGFIFGKQGERYIRASLCQPEAVIREAIKRVRG